MDAASLSSDIEREETRKLILDLREEVHALERRVASLEQHTTALAAPPQPEAHVVPDLEVSADTIPALGRALLGIGGAYLLRALTEMNVLPRFAGIAAGVVYAAVWLWIASRSRRSFSARLAVSTAVLILAPLLWESAVRLHAISPSVAAATLTAFALASRPLEGRARAAMLSSIVEPACALSALVLLLGTQSMLPFDLALLVIASISEFAQTKTRWMVAIAADCGALMMAGLTGRSAGLPENYPAVPTLAAAGVPVLLGAIYMISALRRTVFQNRPFSLFGIVQTAIALTIGIGGAWFVMRAHLPYASSAAAWIVLAAGTGCYVLAAHAPIARNRYTYTSFALVMTAGGIWLLSSENTITVLWLGLAMVLFFVNPGKLGNWNAVALLWLAIILPPHPFVVVFPAAFVIYVLLVRLRDETWSALFAAGAMVFSAAAAVVAQPRLPATAILSAYSIALAATGVRQRRRELIWLMYATMTAAGCLLITREFQSPNTMKLVISLLLFGGTLIVLPKITGHGKSQPRPRAGD